MKTQTYKQTKNQRNRVTMQKPLPSQKTSIRVRVHIGDKHKRTIYILQDFMDRFFIIVCQEITQRLNLYENAKFGAPLFKYWRTHKGKKFCEK